VVAILLRLLLMLMRQRLLRLLRSLLIALWVTVLMLLRMWLVRMLALLVQRRHYDFGLLLAPLLRVSDALLDDGLLPPLHLLGVGAVRQHEQRRETLLQRRGNQL